jgi:hypothetical protein
MAQHTKMSFSADTDVMTRGAGAVVKSASTERARHLYRYLKVALFLLIALRLFASILSAEGRYWDFVNFYNTGSRVFHGERENIYRPDAPIAGKSVGDLPRGFSYGGPPISSYILAPLGALRPGYALFAFKAACAICFALGLVALYGQFRRLVGERLSADQTLCLYLLLALLFEPFWFVFPIGGQATALAFLPLALFVRSYTAGRLWPAAFFLSAAAITKPVLALPIVVFLIAREWDFLKRLACCFLVEGTISLLLFGWSIHAEWLRKLQEDASWWAAPWAKNSSILGFFGNFWLYLGGYQIGPTAPPPLLVGLQNGFKLALIALFVWMVIKARNTDLPVEEKRRHFVLLAVTFALLFSTVVWAHYLAFLFIPLLFLVARYDRLPRGAKVLTVLILLLTFRANWWPITVNLQRALEVDTFAETLAAGLFGSGALILTLILVVAYNRNLLRAQREPKFSTA